MCATFSDQEMPNGATEEVGGCATRRTEALDPERQKLDSSRALKSGDECFSFFSFFDFKYEMVAWLV